MIFDDADLYTPAKLRGAVANLLRSRRETLAGDLTGLVAAESDAGLAPKACRRMTELILEMFAVSVESSGARTGGELLRELHAIAPDSASTRQMFGCVSVCERAVLDVLALDESFGAISQPWRHVQRMVRGASFDLLAAIAEAHTKSDTVEDRLTGLVSRPVFNLALEHELNRARRRVQSLSIILLEAVNLPEIAQEHGQAVGERILERLAILVRRFFRHYDWVARHGSHSIAVLLPETGVPAAHLLATGVCEISEQRLIFRDLRPNDSVSVMLTAAAVGTEPVDAALDAEMIMTAAEQAVGRAEAAGPGRVQRVHFKSPDVTLLDAAAVLQCTPIALRRMIREGQLTTERRGRHIYVQRASMQRLRQTLQQRRLG